MSARFHYSWAEFLVFHSVKWKHFDPAASSITLAPQCDNRSWTWVAFIVRHVSEHVKSLEDLDIRVCTYFPSFLFLPWQTSFSTYWDSVFCRTKSDTPCCILQVQVLHSLGVEAEREPFPESGKSHKSCHTLVYESRSKIASYF